MEKKTEENKIAELIGAKLLGIISTEENEILKNWINQNNENRLLYQSLKNGGRYKEWEHHQNMPGIKEKWSQVHAILRKERKKILVLKVMRYAATLIIPLLLAGGIYYFTQTRMNNTNIEVAEIKPGGNKAVLILDGGKSIELDNLENITLTEKDGTKIEKLDGKLNYIKTEKENEIQPLVNTIRIPRGGEYKLELSDGTKVYLNSMSEFKYPVHFDENARLVELVGEAYFEVSSNGSPFIVRTKDMDIRVLGTKFNVNAYSSSEQVITTLIEGKVQIEHGDQKQEKQLLNPNEQAILDISKHHIEIEKVNASLFTAWKDGKFIFHDMSLGEIMNVLTRWYSCNVFYLNPSVEKLRFSGSINRYGDISHILAIIESTKKVNVEINKTTIIFSEK